MSDPPSGPPLVRHPGPQHQGPARTSPYPTSRLAPAHELVDLAAEIQRADELLSATTHAKLEEIAMQIRSLQARAQAVVESARVDLALHRAKCNFQKRAGHSYHLYRRAPGDYYFSMLSPQEWPACPHEFSGSFRLEADRRFSPLDPNQPKPDLTAMLGDSAS